MYLGKTVKYYENGFVCLVECSKKLQFDRKSSEFRWIVVALWLDLQVGGNYQ